MEFRLEPHSKCSVHSLYHFASLFCFYGPSLPSLCFVLFCFLLEPGLGWRWDESHQSGLSGEDQPQQENNRGKGRFWQKEARKSLADKSSRRQRQGIWHQALRRGVVSRLDKQQVADTQPYELPFSVRTSVHKTWGAIARQGCGHRGPNTWIQSQGHVNKFTRSWQTQPWTAGSQFLKFSQTSVEETVSS